MDDIEIQYIYFSSIDTRLSQSSQVKKYFKSLDYPKIFHEISNFTI